MTFYKEVVIEELEAKVGKRVLIDLNDGHKMLESVHALSNVYYEVQYNVESIVESILKSGSGSAYDRFINILTVIQKSLEVVDRNIRSTNNKQLEVLKIAFNRTMSVAHYFTSNLENNNYEGIEKFLAVFRENFLNEVNLYNTIVSGKSIFTIQMPMVLLKEVDLQQASDPISKLTEVLENTTNVKMIWTDGVSEYFVTGPGGTVTEEEVIRVSEGIKEVFPNFVHASKDKPSFQDLTRRQAQGEGYTVKRNL